MIRVAWIVPDTPTWIGGLNYFRNLLEAILALPNCRVEPVIIGSTSSLPSPFDRCRTVAYPVERPFTPGWVRDHIGKRLLGNGGHLAQELLHQNVRLVSHSIWLGKQSPVPALCWIPDFQHRHLPRLFDDAERRARDASHESAARHGQAVVLSSEDARRDFVRFHPRAAGKSYVLHFVAHVPDSAMLPPANEVLAHHGIGEPFFHIPNQLWVHKNHELVAEALGILASRGRPPLVVCTGQTEDYRQPDHFARLATRVREAGLADRFRFLGLIPYAEVAVLMRQAIAMINPSFFEGWSTTVEEAKSLGKRLLLSDIAVHREQAPPRGSYFDPKDAEQLAGYMAEVIGAHDLAIERIESERAVQELPGRMRQFAKAYEEIVLDVVDRHARRWQR